MIELSMSGGVTIYQHRYKSPQTDMEGNVDAPRVGQVTESCTRHHRVRRALRADGHL